MDRLVCKQELKMSDVKELPKQAQKIQDILTQTGVSTRVVEFDASTRTAADAAQTIGCTVAQIAKSLLFLGRKSNKPVLVIASGVNRVNEHIFEQLIGENVVKADAESVRALTGFVIGGVPPFGHLTPICTFIDEDLLKFSEIWAAAGLPNCSFGIEPRKLVELAGGKVIAVK